MPMKNSLKSFLAAVLAGQAIVLCAHCTEFDVTRYGAKPDSTTDNTASIQKAIDDCSAKGGGRVTVPGGGKYVTYTLNLKNNVELHIDRGATLLGGEDPLKYPVFETNAVWNAERSPRFNRRAMFYTVGQTNVAITGAGTIDGNAEKFHHEVKGKRNWTGHAWWRNSDTNITGRCVFFVGCRDVRLDDVLICGTGANDADLRSAFFDAVVGTFLHPFAQLLVSYDLDLATGFCERGHHDPLRRVLLVWL